MTKIKQFSYKLKGFDFYGLCEVQSIETLPLIVSCTDLYIEGLDSDVKDIVDYQMSWTLKIWCDWKLKTVNKGTLK